MKQKERKKERKKERRTHRHREPKSAEQIVERCASVCWPFRRHFCVCAKKERKKERRKKERTKERKKEERTKESNRQEKQID